MSKEIVKTLPLMMLCLFALPALAAHPYERWAEEFGIDMNVSYDGIRVMRFEGGTFEATEHRAPGKMYTEVQMQGMSSGVILREDLGKSYLLMPSMGFYKEDTLDGGMMQTSNGLEFSKIEKVGSETINGFPSTKFKTRFKDNDGKGAGFMWVTDSGVPIKMEMIYSNKDSEGMRLNMEFTELNLREQDPAVFELPGNLKPMTMGGMANLGAMMQQGAAAPAAGTQSPYQSNDQDLSARQQTCLEEAAAQAARKQEKEKKKKGFGRLMGAVSRTAGRFGAGGDIGKINQDIYDANATASDVSIMAEELGISEDDVERCRNPS
jgi:hypothetical protein